MGTIGKKWHLPFALRLTGQRAYKNSKYNILEEIPWQIVQRWRVKK
jgi:hypothetical protein